METESRSCETHSDITQDRRARNEASDLSTQQHTYTVPDIILGGFWELDPPPYSSQPSPATLPPFPCSPLDNLMTKLRDEAERNAERPSKELSAIEKVEKEKLEEQCRVNREKENKIWSSCHLFVGGSGIPGSGIPGSGPVEIVDGVKVCGEWAETKIEQKSAAPKEDIGNGSTAVTSNHPFNATPSPQELVHENWKFLEEGPRSPCDRKDNYHFLTPSGRNKIRELEFVDSEDDEEIEKEIELAFAPLTQNLARASSNKFGYERRRPSRDIDGETLSGITFAETHPLDAIPAPGGVDQEKKRLSQRRLEDYFKATDSGPSTTIKKKKYHFEVETDDEDEDGVDGETREDRLQEFLRAMESKTGGCSRCSVKPPSQNPDIDNVIKRNRARLDSIR